MCELLWLLAFSFHTACVVVVVVVVVCQHDDYVFVPFKELASP